MKKRVYTLIVDGYPKEITNVTVPLIENFAKKIDAEFYVISDRKFPEYPPVYEKFQIYELSQKDEIEWNYFIDADTMVSPEMIDVTAVIPKDTVVFNRKDISLTRFKPDRHFLRDGRFIGEGNWFAVASDWCIDLWHPLDDLTLEEATANITLSNTEKFWGYMEPSHLIDDYNVSRNISKYGLKHMLFTDICTHFGMNSPLYHLYNVDPNEKIIELNKVLEAWLLK